MSAQRLTDAQAELESYVEGLAEAGYSLDAITAEVERIAAMSDDEYAALQRDGSGRITIDATDEAQAPGHRSYFNIRDRAQGDPAAAQRLAEWALAKYRKAQERIAAVNEAAAARLADIEAWRTVEVAKAERETEFFTGVLDQYHSDFAEGERTIKLVGGRLKLTKQVDVKQWDEKAALAWAREQTDADTLAPRSISKSAINDVLTKRDDGTFQTKAGAAVTFLRMVPPATRDRFSVELT